MRYEHFLTHLKSRKFPRAVLTLATSHVWGPVCTETYVQTAELQGWAVSLLTPRDGRYAVVRMASGAERRGFWSLLEEAAERTPGLWVVSATFRRSAALLGLWERLETRYVRIDGTDPRLEKEARREVSELQGPGDDTGAAGAGEIPTSRVSDLRDLQSPPGDATGEHRPARRHVRHGLCILEDPPIHIQIRIGGKSHRVSWVDAANYGLDPRDLGDEARAAATRLAEWFVGAAEAVQTLGGKTWCATAGSQSMAIYRSHYIRVPLLAHTDPLATALEAAALHGGRCEPFRLGRIPGPCEMHDYAALYPSLCAELPLPVRLCGDFGNAPLRDLADCARRNEVIAEVDLETDSPDYPLREGTGVIYPVGRFTTVLASPEITHALARGRVQRTRRAVRYQSSPVLSDYVRALWALRREASKERRDLLLAYLKSLHVSIVGKFAQRERWWTGRPGAEHADAWGEWYAADDCGEMRRWRAVADHVSLEHVGGFAHGSMPAVTATVLSAGRVRLLEAMAAAGREHVYYVDTDALLVSEPGAAGLAAAGLIQDGEWGYLRRVAEGAECVISGVRHYSIGDRVRESGRVRGEQAPTPTPGRVWLWPWIGYGLRGRMRPGAERILAPYSRPAQCQTGVVDDTGRVAPYTRDRWEDTF